MSASLIARTNCGGEQHIHLTADEFQATLDCALGLELLLLQEDGSHQLVDGFIVLQDVEFLGPISD